MGMDLSGDYLLLDEKEYNELKNHRLYIKSIYELKLISVNEAEEYKKKIMFDAIEDYLKYTGVESFIEDFKECETLKDIFEKSAYEYSEDYLPLTLEEFLDFDHAGEWVVNELREETIYDKKCYLLVQLRYW